MPISNLYNGKLIRRDNNPESSKYVTVVIIFPKFRKARSHHGATLGII
jgi:hypothetical protein